MRIARSFLPVPCFGMQLMQHVPLHTKGQMIIRKKVRKI